MPRQNSFFEALMYEKSSCTSLIPSTRGEPIPISTSKRPMTPLPKKLYLQLDNSATDKKNRFVKDFCSLLIVWWIFKEVTVGFLVVDHTHEYIIAQFSYLFKLIKWKNGFFFIDLMNTFFL